MLLISRRKRYTYRYQYYHIQCCCARPKIIQIGSPESTIQLLLEYNTYILQNKILE